MGTSFMNGKKILPAINSQSANVSSQPPAIQRKCAECEEEQQLQRKENTQGAAFPAPAIVHEAVSSGGRPMDADTRSIMEPCFNYDFSNVKIHDDHVAAKSADSINALAYTSGNNVVFNSGQYNPKSEGGKKLLAHELTHVVQQDSMIRPYRPSSAFNFGKGDTDTLMEEAFNHKSDKSIKPWIEMITVNFDKQITDAYGAKPWVGTAKAKYYNNEASLPEFSFSVTGGSTDLGRSDRGNFIVHRIEGIGYNSGTFSEPYKPSEREGPNKRYSTDKSGNMDFAVFYNKGEALHAGSLDASSHGCVHVDWDVLDTIRQVNFHSVIGLTKVNVKYSK